MPRSANGLLACWNGHFGKYNKAEVLKAILFFFFFLLNFIKVILLCLMSTIWRERNACTFKDSELLDMKLKFLLLHSLYEWEQATSSTSLTDFLEFLDQLNFRC